MEYDSQTETAINKPKTFKPINCVQWSKECEKYVAQYKTARKVGVSLSYFIHNNSKTPDAEAMESLPQTEQEYWNLTIDNRNRPYIEYSKQLYSILEELMLSEDGYE